MLSGGVIKHYSPFQDTRVETNVSDGVTYSTIKPAKPSSRPFFLGTTNSCYASLFLSLLSKEPMYVVLASVSEDISISFFHVRALCLVLLQFPQRRRAG